MSRINVDDRHVIEALNNLMQRSQNLRSPLEELGEYLIDSTKRRFDQATAPDGTPWPANAPVTLARKHGTDPLIGESRRLRDEIHYTINGDTLEWGSALVYAAMQQFGGQRAEHPHLWGDIPARPFLGLSEEDDTTALEIINDWLAEAL